MKNNLEFSKWKVSIATSHAEIEWNTSMGACAQAMLFRSIFAWFVA